MYKRLMITVLMLCVFIFPLVSQEAQNKSNNKISKIGSYEGYSSEVYDSYQRESVYIEMRDGIRIAIDIYRPQKNGIVEQKPLPVIWNHTQYTRALKGPGGNVITLVSSPVGMAFIKRGYILAIADARGTGASFGIQNGIFAQETTQDAYEIIEWIASQPWCDGNIGMMGGSYEGVTQLMAASTKSPHLKAIFPAMFLFDLYDFPYHNGVFYDDMLISREQRNIDFISPVDADPDKTLLKEAITFRSYNRNLYEIFSPLAYRNSFDSLTHTYPYIDWSPSNYIDEINESGVAVYIYGGWMDLFPKDALLLYANLTTPKKLLMLDTPHSSGKDPKLVETYIAEQLRWFDYWLKGIPNGIMDEPPIYVQKMGTSLKEDLVHLLKWPMDNVLKLKLYFDKGQNINESTSNKGSLSLRISQQPEGQDIYKADYSTTSGTTTRWDDAAIKKFGYSDMASNDDKGMTYTLELFPRDHFVCGHPVVKCWVSSSTPDFDLFIYLEDVDTNNVSTYVSEGCIRASHYQLNDAPYNTFGLPYHSSYTEDIREIKSGEIIELSFDLLPVYYLFQEGHRIRITIACADRDNTNSHKIFIEPEITIYRNSNFPSFIELPFYTGSQ